MRYVAMEGGGGVQHHPLLNIKNYDRGVGVEHTLVSNRVKIHELLGPIHCMVINNVLAKNVFYQRNQTRNNPNTTTTG